MTITEPDLAAATSLHPDITEPTLDPGTIAEIDAIKLSTYPSFDEVVEAIVTECHAAGVACTERQARQIIGYFSFLAGARRRTRYSELELHLTDLEIWRFHAQLDVVMPDDTSTQPDDVSAHRLLERFVLRDEANTKQFVHTKSDTVARDCTVWVMVRPNMA